jgi:hypothetical protein
MATASEVAAIRSLTNEINKLHYSLDARVTAMEQDLRSNAEDRAELMRLNASISNTVKQAKQLQLDIKERALESQRPPSMMGYEGYTAGRWKHPATQAIEKFIRKSGDPSALTREELSYISFNHMNFDAYPPEQKVLISAAADLGGFF